MRNIEVNTEQFWTILTSGDFLSMIKESAKGRSVHSSGEVFNMMKTVYAKDEPDREHMYFVFMNRKNEILKIEKLFSGSIAGSAVYPREVIKRVIQYHAAGVVMIHNHPSGDPAPSMEDKRLTFEMVIALHSICVQLLDHIIIGRDYYSFADDGLIKEYANQYKKFVS